MATWARTVAGEVGRSYGLEAGGGGVAGMFSLFVRCIGSSDKTFLNNCSFTSDTDGTDYFHTRYEYHAVYPSLPPIQSVTRSKINPKSFFKVVGCPIFVYAETGRTCPCTDRVLTSPPLHSTHAVRFSCFVLFLFLFFLSFLTPCAPTDAAPP